MNKSITFEHHTIQLKDTSMDFIENSEAFNCQDTHL